MKNLTLYHLKHMKEIQQKDINNSDFCFNVDLRGFDKEPKSIKTILESRDGYTFYIMFMDYATSVRYFVNGVEIQNIKSYNETHYIDKNLGYLVLSNKSSRLGIFKRDPTSN